MVVNSIVIVIVVVIVVVVEENTTITTIILTYSPPSGELCVMFRQDVLPYSGKLLPIIIGHILDTSSAKKQEIAVKTLGQFVSATGLVVIPYLEYPQLLPSMLELLEKV